MWGIFSFSPCYWLLSLEAYFSIFPFSRTATPQKRCHSNGSILFFQRTIKLHRSHAEKTSPSAAPTVDGSEIRRSPVEGKVVYHPIIYLTQVLEPSKRWLALGFLNHQQYLIFTCARSSFETLPSPFLSKLYHSSCNCCSVLGWIWRFALPVFGFGMFPRGLANIPVGAPIVYVTHGQYQMLEYAIELDIEYV